MEKFLNLKTPQEVYEEIIGNISPVKETETIKLDKSIGRVLSIDIVAPEDYPDFDRSTVDGFAVRAKDVFGASTIDPVYLVKEGIVNIGEGVSYFLKEGDTYEIVTGAMLPKGADAVVMREYARDSGEYIEIIKGVTISENIIKKGDDIKKDSLVLRAGELISRGVPGLLSGIGISDVNVYKRLNIHIYSSGDEIVQPGESKEIGKVRDVNAFNLFSLLKELDVNYQFIGSLRDDLDVFTRAFETSLRETDLVVLSGGSSKSARDYTENAINSLGKPGVILHGILMSPGKPTIIGNIGEKYIFGLPGHPTSCFVVAFLFLVPLIKKLSGMVDYIPHSFMLPLKESVYSKASKETYILGQLKDRAAFPLPTFSPLISYLSYSDGLIRIPLGTEGMEEGDIVEFFPWRN